MDIGSVIVTVKQFGVPNYFGYIPVGAYGIFVGFHKGFARVTLDLRPFKIERPETVKQMLREAGRTDSEYVKLISAGLPEDYIALVAEPVEFDQEFEAFAWKWNQLKRDVQRFGFKYDDE